jgi:hypothetical protein
MRHESMGFQTPETQAFAGTETFAGKLWSNEERLDF